MKPTKTKRFEKSLKKNNSVFSELFFSILIFAVMLLILSNPSRYSKGTISGINLFITAVMPGLFPFMLLTKLLTEIGFVFKFTKKCDKFSNKLFGTPGVSLYALLMSILSGYPIGAKIISDLYEKNLISQTDAKKMSVFCTTSGPIFVIGAVGIGMFGEYKIGLILYISHIISSILMGIGYNLLTKKKQEIKTPQNFLQIEIIKKDNIFATCISQTINSIFVVGAYITIFYLITEMCESLDLISGLSNALYHVFKPFNISLAQCQSFAYGIIEVTRGCKSFALNPSSLSIALTSGIISFSGISIIMQSMAFLKNTKIKMHTFIGFKLVHMILSIFLCFLGLIIFV